MTATTRILARVAAGALLAWAGVTAIAAGPAAAHPAVPGRCPALYVLGLQGTGQSSPTSDPDSDTGMLASLFVPMLNLSPPGSVQREYLAYDASFGGLAGTGTDPTPYSASVLDGLGRLDRAAATELSRCPQTQLAVAGYSQGAGVGSRWARRVGAGRDRVPADRVAAVALYGDPERPAGSSVLPGRPGQTSPSAPVGTTGSDTASVQLSGGADDGEGVELPDDDTGFGRLSGRVAEFCVAADLYCAGPGPGRAAMLRTVLGLAADTDFTNLAAIPAAVTTVVSRALTVAALNDWTVGPGGADYRPRVDFADRVATAADPAAERPTRGQTAKAARTWQAIGVAVAADPVTEIPRIGGEFAAQVGAAVTDDSDLLTGGTWQRFAPMLAAHTSYGHSDAVTLGARWLAAAARDLQDQP